jgi:hypothetical protein
MLCVKLAQQRWNGCVSDFDQMGIVVDWFDACRKGDLESLLELYGEDASLECQCHGTRLYRGRAELGAYWRSRLGAFVSAGFGMEDISPAPHGVALEYSIADSLRIRASFSFSADGKISRTICEPARQSAADCCARQ